MWIKLPEKCSNHKTDKDQEYREDKGQTRSILELNPTVIIPDVTTQSFWTKY